MTRRRLLALAASLLTAVLVALLGPLSTSQAAQGQKWQQGVPWAGIMKTNKGKCSVTVVSEFLAIAAKHCGAVNPQLKLDVASWATRGHNYNVKKIVANRNLDVEAIFLRNRTGLSTIPLRDSVARDWFYAWGYGKNWSNVKTEYLTRAEFSLPQLCLSDLRAAWGSLCWQTDAKNSVCRGDSGGPITQDGAIVGMIVGGRMAKGNCSTVNLGFALTVNDMQPWLNQMIADANPFP
jgi:Trypsin